MGLLGKKKKEEIKEAPKVEIVKEITPEERRILKENEKYKRLSDLALEKAKELQIPSASDGIEVVGVIYNEKSKAYMFKSAEKLNIGDVVNIIDGNGNKRTVMVVIANQLVDSASLSLPLKEVSEILYRASGEPLKLKPIAETKNEAKEISAIIEVKPEESNEKEEPAIIEAKEVEQVEKENQASAEIEVKPIEKEEIQASVETEVKPEEKEETQASAEIEVKPEEKEEIPASPIIEVKPEEAIKETDENDENEEAKPERSELLKQLGLTEEMLAKLEAIPDIDDSKLAPPVKSYTPVKEKKNRIIIPGFGAVDVDDETQETQIIYVDENGNEIEGFVPEEGVEYAEYEDDEEEYDEEFEAYMNSIPEGEAKESNKVIFVDENGNEISADEISEGYKIVAENDSLDEQYRIVKTYEAKLSMASDELKGYYDTIKNVLEGCGLKSTITKSSEKFKLKKENYAIVRFTAKSLQLYLNLNTENLDSKKYKGRDVGAKKIYSKTPFLYKVSSPRKFKKAIELILLMAKQNSLVLTEVKDIKHSANYPNVSEDELIEKGFIKKTIINKNDVIEQNQE